MSSAVPAGWQGPFTLALVSNSEQLQNKHNVSIMFGTYLWGANIMQLRCTCPCLICICSE